MELLLQTQEEDSKAIVFWRNPSAWLKEQNLGHGYWIFFTAAFFFDAGFSVYFFWFNLYLLDLNFNERMMGLIGGAMALGSLMGTLPAGELARKFGVRPLLILCFVGAPLMGALRVIWMWAPAQIGLAFLSGMAMCNWGVCFLPAVARLTTEKNRTSAFSLIFSVSIGTSALGGVVCGYLPQWLRTLGIEMQVADVKRLILLISCGVAAIGLVPVLRLRVSMPLPDGGEMNARSEGAGWLREWKYHPFLLRYLPCMALWSAVLAAFSPFANVYLSHDLHIPMTRIGLIFSTTQMVQLLMGLVTPIVLRVLGLMNGIVATQVAAALMLAVLAGARNGRLAVVLYLVFAAVQWMSSPGLYNLLMNETPDKDRSRASAMTMFCNALMGSAATAAAGASFTRFGYPPVLLGIAVAAMIVALLFRFLVAPHVRHVSS